MLRQLYVREFQPESGLYCFIPQDEGTDLPYFPSTKENRPSLYIVPSGIRPAVQRTAIEVSVYHFKRRIALIIISQIAKILGEYYENDAK